MLALQQPVNGSGVSRQSQAELQPGTPGPGHDFSTTGLQPQQPHQHPQVQPLQQPTTPLIQIQSVNESLHGPFPLSLHEQQQLPLLQRSLGPLDNPSSSWIVNDFPPLPRSSQATLNPGLMSQSYGSIHPLHQQQASRPTTASNAFQQQQQPHHNMQGQLHFMQQQQLAHFQGLESGQGIHSHLGAQVTPSLMDSPANTNVQHFQGLNQDASMGFDANRWNDATKSLQMDMFHIASPPLTPSGAMARSPGSFSSFGMNNNVKRPPLWPMDRAPNTPFPRQTLTPSQSSKASNLQHIPCKFFKSGACTAGKNCLFSHNRDPPSESMVCKYFLKGNCKFGAKCSLSHSFLAPDRKTSALLPSSNSTGRTRLERRASSSAILNNNLWPSEPLSPTYTSSLQHQTIQLNGNNVEFSMGRPASQHGISKSVMNRVSHDSLGNNLYQTSSREIVGNRTPFFEDDPTSVDFTGELRTPVAPPHFLESRVRQHLAAPLPIRQRSLPDIFRLTPLSHEGGALPASPFYQPGNKALFLSVSCEGGETSPSSPLRLHSIPEQNSQHGHHRDGDSVRRRSFVGSDIGIGGDDYTDSENEGSLDQGFLPSSLNDLLTTHERQCRQSRQEDVEPRSTMLPSPVSGSLRDGKDEDDVRLTLAPRVSLSVQDPSEPRLQFQRVLSEFDQHQVNADTSISPLMVFIPGTSIYSYPSSSSYDEESRFPASRGQETHYKEKSATLDPFCPFPQDDEVQFAMDDDVAIGGDAGKQGSSSPVQTASKNQESLMEQLVDDAVVTSASTMCLNRAVGSSVNVERQHSHQQQEPLQQQPRTLTPVSLKTREDDGGEIDFSSLSISESGRPSYAHN